MKCACNGTGVITNDMGMGMYVKHPCSCAASERSREERQKQHQEWLEMFNEAYKLNQEGKWDAEAYRRFKEGKQSDNSTGAVIHERTAS